MVMVMIMIALTLMVIEIGVLNFVIIFFETLVVMVFMNVAMTFVLRLELMTIVEIVKI
jgi:hypothetical protein